MKSREEIRDFIREWHREITVEGMADALGLSITAVTKWCIRMDVKALTVRERNFNFVKDNHAKMSVEKMAKMLEIREQYFMKLYKDEFNLLVVDNKAVEPLEPTPKVIKKKKKQPQPMSRLSPREILSGYQLQGAGHYYDPSKDLMFNFVKELDDRLK